jgi:hypothetical protein
VFSCSAIFIAAKVFSFRPSKIASGGVYLLQRRIIFPAPVGVGALDFAFAVPHLPKWPAFVFIYVPRSASHKLGEMGKQA